MLHRISTTYSFNFSHAQYALVMKAQETDDFLNMHGVFTDDLMDMPGVEFIDMNWDEYSDVRLIFSIEVEHDSEEIRAKISTMLDDYLKLCEANAQSQ